MLDFLPQQYSRVLEIGCSDGSFAAQLNDNVEYWGIDPAMSQQDNFKRIFDNFCYSTFEEAFPHLPVSYFDLIVCNDVIEHVKDHDLLLRQVKKLIIPGGFLAGSVPNLRHIGTLYQLLIKKDWRYRSQGVLDKTHLRFFTMKSLQRSLSEAGFDDFLIRGINSELVRKPFWRKVTIGLCIFLSAGFLLDTRFVQIGFRVRA